MTKVRVTVICFLHVAFATRVLEGRPVPRLPLEKFSSPWKNVLDIIQKMCAPLGKLFAPSGVQSLLRACWKVRRTIAKLTFCPRKKHRCSWFKSLPVENPRTADMSQDIAGNKCCAVAKRQCLLIFDSVRSEPKVSLSV